MARANYKRPDHFARRAKKEGYAARSVYKLEEIDSREGLFRPGLRVLDLGAAPGSWMQYVSSVVGGKGVVVGVDLKPLKRSLASNERFVEGDLYDLDPEVIRGEAQRFDVVLSDMMPNTIGHKSSDHLRSIALAERALWVADRLLRPGGHFLIKVFQGAEFDQYRNMMRERYARVKVKKPEGSRKTSREIYLLGLNKKPAEDSGED